MLKNLVVPSHFWTTNAKFDSCCQRYMAIWGETFILVHTYVQGALNYRSVFY